MMRRVDDNRLELKVLATLLVSTERSCVLAWCDRNDVE